MRCIPARPGRATRLRAVLAACAIALAGCVSVGREFPVRPVRQIEVGATTHREIAQMFGKPWRRGYESGRRTWTYGHYRYSLFGDAKTRDLVVRFDENGIVASYTFNSTHPEDVQR